MADTPGEPKIQMMNIGGVLTPRDRTLRPHRPIPGLDEDYGITQTGHIFSITHNELWDADNWPRAWLPHGEGLAILNVVAATAAVWLTAEQRAEIRSRLQAGAHHGQADVMVLAKEFQVSKHAIALVANTAEEAIIPFTTEGGEGEGDLQRVELAEVESYEAYLHEPSRPPSRGGDTSALHAHVLIVDGQKYSFSARGTKKWVYKGDRATFTYRTTPNGYRNIVRTSVITQDKNGKPVVRGDRRTKSVLRTAPTRMPGSRRDRRG